MIVVGGASIMRVDGGGTYYRGKHTSKKFGIKEGGGLFLKEAYFRVGRIFCLE